MIKEITKNKIDWLSKIVKVNAEIVLRTFFYVDKNEKYVKVIWECGIKRVKEKEDQTPKIYTGSPLILGYVQSSLIVSLSTIIFILLRFEITTSSWSSP
jgi:hypothetical protein